MIVYDICYSLMLLVVVGEASVSEGRGGGRGAEPDTIGCLEAIALSNGVVSSSLSLSSSSSSSLIPVCIPLVNRTLQISK